jgi:hypothetical protein
MISPRLAQRTEMPVFIFGPVSIKKRDTAKLK